MSEYTPSTDHIGKPKPIKVIVIGAGISGIGFAYKAKQIKNLEFVIYEKNEGVGGTWFESRFPGCSCDVPAHSYTYSWVGNPEWSSVYASAKEIHSFYHKLAMEYGVFENGKFQHKVIGLEWLNSEARWAVKIEDLNSKRVFTDHAEVVINCGGVLNNWKWPDIPGLHCFAGKRVHSAAYDESLDLEGKRVAVIGSGASGIQIVPTIQPVVKSLVSFNRSPNWIAGQFAGQFAPEGRTTRYSEEQKRKFRSDPDAFLQYRSEIEHSVNARFPAFYKDSEAQRNAVAFVSETMRKRLKNNPVLSKSLIPDFPVGCRRVTPGEGYLEALIKSNVQVVTDPISKVTETGILTNNGKHFEIDVIIAATGYDTSFVPRFPIIGLDKVDLRDKWSSNGAAAYLSVAVPNLPNYFLATGPNTPISNGSIIPALEIQLDFALAFVKKLQTQSLRYVCVTQEATDEFNQHKDAVMKKMSWSGNCTSWYKNGTVDGKVLGPWPGSLNHFLETLQTPRFEDFIFKYEGTNRFQYLGDGVSTREANGEPLGWYVKKFDGID